MALDISRVILGDMQGGTNYATYKFIVGSGVTVTAGDFVYFASGVVTNASIATQLIAGYALETATGNATGTVTVLCIIDPDVRYLLKNDNIGTTFASTHVGTKFDLIGATGAQLVDTSTTGTSGQLVCLEYNPVIDPVSADTTYGVFKVQESVWYSGSGAQ
jgi:hypothetical protein